MLRWFKLGADEGYQGLRRRVGNCGQQQAGDHVSFLIALSIALAPFAPVSASSPPVPFPSASEPPLAAASVSGLKPASFLLLSSSFGEAKNDDVAAALRYARGPKGRTRPTLVRLCFSNLLPRCPNDSALCGFQNIQARLSAAVGRIRADRW